ncbi:MAG TPA: SH3 domain-containing protein [Anaerolineales bacterium]|nr:SH3 domain-containing protein [Anaerolineales bacterium]HND90239.1 SH3 domain-containing protein [Anaerolineales bacterium]
MKKFMGLCLVAGIFISACSMPSAAGPSDSEISTAAALTVQAVINSTPLASPTAAGGQQLDPEAATPVVITPTFSQPMASVGDVINCRSGPGTNFERVTQILPTDSVKIVGFYPPNYWVVNTKDGDCWISGEFTTPVGSFAAVPTVTAPPTPEGGGPEAATFPKNGWTFFCYGPGKADITLSWNDNAENELGYRIIRDGEKVAELAPNTKYFAETIDLNSGESVAYQIQAYNEAGSSDSATANITCP